MSQLKKTVDAPPYSGVDLDKYCSNPKKLLVIETNYGVMKIQLFDKVAPNHVAQIVKFAKAGMYDSCTFHRVIPDFMIQGGDPNSKDNDLSNDGTGGMGDKLKAEFNAVSHKRGVCSMARTNDPNSATSQFFICHGNPTFLDHQYTAWGQLVEGYDALDKIANLPKNAQDNPGKDAIMKKVYVTE
ncbi:MAG TPA: peptidylprolyl isomerase [Candidatus Kapabacteria bacterium]|nr:peptidylprolyl isomerase [Candidatus Kapabacteria bacterium]